MRISAQTDDNGPTPETRMRVDSADHRATTVPPPISRHLRNIVRKISYVSLPLSRGGPDNLVATESAGRLLSEG